MQHKTPSGANGIIKQIPCGDLALSVHFDYAVAPRCLFFEHVCRQHFILVDDHVCPVPTHACVHLYPRWAAVGLAYFQRHRRLRARSFVTGAND